MYFFVLYINKQIFYTYKDLKSRIFNSLYKLEVGYKIGVLKINSSTEFKVSSRLRNFTVLNNRLN